MKQFYLVLCALLYTIVPSAQQLSPEDFFTLNTFGAGKFQQQAARKGFEMQQQEKDYIRMLYTRDSSRSLYITRRWNVSGGWMQMEKITAEEYALLKQKLLQDGFEAGTTAARVYTELFEKGGTTITASAEINLEENRRLYNILITTRNLPKAKDLQFAEDLLVFDSHRQLQQVFGMANVVRDQFYNPDGTSVPCSVIFPETQSEAVFLWNEPGSLRSLAAVRVGANNQTKGSMDYSRSVQQNRWQSRQGVYANMSLNQLCSLNGEAIRFYDWGADTPGLLAPKGNGRLDFGRLGFVFSCFNCNEEKYQSARVVGSDDAIADYRKIHVATLILTPEPILQEQQNVSVR